MTLSKVRKKKKCARITDDSFPLSRPGAAVRSSGRFRSPAVSSDWAAYAARTGRPTLGVAFTLCSRGVRAQRRARGCCRPGSFSGLCPAGPPPRRWSPRVGLWTRTRCVRCSTDFAPRGLFFVAIALVPIGRRADRPSVPRLTPRLPPQVFAQDMSSLPVTYEHRGTGGRSSVRCAPARDSRTDAPLGNPNTAQRLSRGRDRRPPRGPSRVPSASRFRALPPSRGRRDADPRPAPHSRSSRPPLFVPSRSAASRPRCSAARACSGGTS